MKAELPPNEAARLAALEGFQILDTAPDPAIDEITRLAAQICGTPMALVSLVDRDRQWFLSRIGIDVPATSRDIAFCAHTLLQPNLLVVSDATQDPRFSDNPLVTGGSSFRFYAGMPLITRSGHAIGCLCVLDTQPRGLTPGQQQTLGLLARQVVVQLEHREATRRLQDNEERFRAIAETAADGMDNANAAPHFSAEVSAVLGRVLELARRDTRSAASGKTSSPDSPDVMDAILAETAEIFCETAPALHHKLRSAAAAGNLEAVQFAAHSLKGAIAVFPDNHGAAECHRRVQEIEEFAALELLEQVQILVPQLDPFLGLLLHNLDALVHAPGRARR